MEKQKEILNRKKLVVKGKGEEEFARGLAPEWARGGSPAPKWSRNRRAEGGERERRGGCGRGRNVVRGIDCGAPESVAVVVCSFGFA